MRTYFDSSALVKRYVLEAGTDSVLARCSEADEVVLSVLVVPEVLSALNRLRREGLLDTPSYTKLKGDLAADVAESSVVDLTPAVVRRAVHCVESSALRALDALHVAAAATSAVDLFVSADRRQCEAARLLGLTVEEIFT